MPVRTSAGSMAVVSRSIKNSRAGTRLSPASPRKTIVQSSAVAHRRVLGRGVGVGQAAADGAARPGRQVTDQLGRLEQQRRVSLDQIGGADFPLPGHRADGDMVVAVLDEGEPVDAIEVDQGFRPGQSEVKDRDQTLPARQNLRVRAVTGQQVERLVQARRREIVELWRFHVAPCPRMARLPGAFVDGRSNAADESRAERAGRVKLLG